MSGSNGELVQILDANRDVVFHPAGGCAMGDDGSPCTDAGRVRALDNVWIGDATVFPTAGNAHPTLTVVAHAMRVANDVARYLRRPTCHASSK
jgi:choline dehydrogenase-like flavoprotein